LTPVCVICYKLIWADKYCIRYFSNHLKPMLRRDLFANAARIQPTGEPLDWMENQFPAKWKLNNREVTFNWD
jgi:hypothetical protein